MSNMLTTTIQAETEALLKSDDQRESNRAAVAMCRKFLQTPFVDIEQGQALVLARAEAEEKMGARFGRRANAP